MAALPPGSEAPPFQLQDAIGNAWDLAQAFAGGPAVLAFFKVTCPTCKLAFPYLEKLNQAYGDCVPFLGVAQDPGEAAVAFARELGPATFPLLIDDAPYPISVQYGLTNVPTVFAVEPGGKIAQTLVGFSKKDLQGLAEWLAERADRLIAPLFPAGDPAPAFQPG